MSGWILASALLGNEQTAPEKPPGSMGQSDRPLPGNSSLPEIPGTGVLRPGDSGHGVHELQVRLLQIPHIYDGGAVNGRYDSEVRRAVARFQKRYGIHGDESGVYGDATRHALMLRTNGEFDVGKSVEQLLHRDCGDQPGRTLRRAVVWARAPRQVGAVARTLIHCQGRVGVRPRRD